MNKAQGCKLYEKPQKHQRDWVSRKAGDGYRDWVRGEHSAGKVRGRESSDTKEAQAGCQFAKPEASSSSRCCWGVAGFVPAMNVYVRFLPHTKTPEGNNNALQHSPPPPSLQRTRWSRKELCGRGCRFLSVPASKTCEASLPSTIQNCTRRMQLAWCRHVQRLYQIWYAPNRFGCTGILAGRYQLRLHFVTALSALFIECDSKYYFVGKASKADSTPAPCNPARSSSAFLPDRATCRPVDAFFGGMPFRALRVALPKDMAGAACSE